jgi:hypothetical protein
LTAVRQTWVDRWVMAINVKKSKVMHVSRANK